MSNKIKNIDTLFQQKLGNKQMPIENNADMLNALLETANSQLASTSIIDKLSKTITQLSVKSVSILISITTVASLGIYIITNEYKTPISETEIDNYEVQGIEESNIHETNISETSIIIDSLTVAPIVILKENKPQTIVPKSNLEVPSNTTNCSTIVSLPADTTVKQKANRPITKNTEATEKLIIIEDSTTTTKIDSIMPITPQKATKKEKKVSKKKKEKKKKSKIVIEKLR